MSGEYSDLGLRKTFAAMLSEQEILNAIKLLQLSVQFDVRTNHKRGSENHPHRPVPIPDAVRPGLFKVKEMHFIVLLGILDTKNMRSMTDELNKRSKGEQAFFDAQQATLSPMSGAFGTTAWEPTKTISKEQVKIVQANAHKFLQEDQALAQSGIVEKGARRRNMRDQVEELRREWKRLGG